MRLVVGRRERAHRAIRSAAQPNSAHVVHCAQAPDKKQHGVRTLLMPGMDGTGLLFGGLAPLLGNELPHDVVRYPTSDALGYDELLDRLVVPAGDVAIVAESFSGPLAIRLAATLGERLRALVLVATFAQSPSWVVAPASLFGGLVFRVPPPRSALRMFLLDKGSPDDEVDNLQRIIRSIAPTVLAKTLREIAEVDVRGDLARVRCPVMYIRAARDRVVGASSVDVIRSAVPALKIETLDAPHLVLQRRPQESARLLSDFIHSSC